MSKYNPSGFDRRTFLRAAGLGAAAVGTSAVLASCGLKGSSAPAAGGTLNIGFVSPQTGPISTFASSDSFILKQFQDYVGSGVMIGGKKRKIEVIVKDTQSSATRASEVAKELITQDKVDLVVSSGTPDTGNPVANQCEAAGVPNITTIVPWESWFYTRGGKDGVGFKYSTLFFFGMQEFADCFFPMWSKMNVTNKNVSALWPEDQDANAFRTSFGPLITKAGYTVIDGGKYDDGATDFSAQIAKFKQSGAELFTCTPIPPDFETYWKQAAQQGYRPKLATTAKVMLFPSEAEALGELSNNIATDIWWSPFHPYKSTFDGSTAKQLSDKFTADTGKQWTQALGSVYSLFEIAVAAFKQASDPTNKDEVAAKLQKMKIECMSGPLDFASGPQPGIALQHPVGGQWRPSTKFPWDITIVDNTANTSVPLGGTLQPTFS
ncbi:MAG TPA: ABC transporter substrate-binding protein [Microbacteriaceae bacterium]